MSDQGIWFFKTQCIYHVNTPWSVISDRLGGADLVDQWQIISNGEFVGRHIGWEGILRITNLPSCFKTREDMIKFAKLRCGECVEHYKQKIKDLQDMEAGCDKYLAEEKK